MENLAKISGVYYVRIVVPVDLRCYVNKREFKISLKTAQKTLAKKLARPLISKIYEQFFMLRTYGMSNQTVITAEAVAIFKRLYPNNETHIMHSTVQTFGPGWNIETDQGLRPSPALIKVQKNIDEGWQLDANDVWQFIGVMPQQSVAVPYPVSEIAIQPQVKRLKQKRLTLRQAVDLYLKHCEAPEDTTFYKARAESSMGVERTATKHLIEWVGSGTVKIDEVAQRDLKDFSRFFIEEKNNAKSSVRTWVNALSRFFKYLSDFEHISACPEIVFPKLHAEDKRKTANLPYTRAMLQNIFDYIATNIPKDRRQRVTQIELAYFLLLLLYTGFRKTEGKGSADNIEIYNNVKVFEQKELSKGTVTSIRFVPLHRDLISTGFLQFVEKSGKELFRKNESNYRRPFDNIKKALGYGAPREYTFHSFRTTFDSNLQGIVEDTTRRLFTGHALTGMDATYVHQLEDRSEFYKTEINKLKYNLDLTKLKFYLASEIKTLF